MALHRRWPWVHYFSSLLFLSLSSHGDVTRELVFDIIENVPEGTLVGTITGPAPPYLIVGVDSDLSIDQSNGEIRTKVKLDRELRDIYSFVAIPINGEGVRVSVHVKDRNDNAPIFASNVMTVEFPENTPRDVKRTLQPARDRDLGLFNTQRYVISGGNVNNAFRLSSHRERDGVLYLDLQVNGFLDRETTPFYNLVIDAYDGGVPPLKGSMTVHVTLTDVNDNSPIFNQSRYFATISENVTVGTSVLQVFATDTDSGPNGQVSYAINRRQTDKDSLFKIDPSTGVISVNRPLDFETKDLHELVVIARDNGIQPLETTVFVSIRVLDVNDHQPSISLVFLTRDGTPRVTEGATLGEFVARVTVHDPDSKIDYENVNVSLIGGRGHFELSNRNGAVYIVVASKDIDREAFPEYALTLVATDPNIPTLNASTTFRIQVDDVNDNAPAFEDNEFYASVLEVAEPGTSVFQVSATDADVGKNSVLKYKVEPVYGSHSKWFRIDSDTGLITTQAQVDCETESMPRVVVVATDSGQPSLSSSATVFIQIRDVNDNEPLFDQSFYNVSVTEDAPVGRCILKVSATDPDCGINARVNFTIRENNLKRPLPFRLNSTTGELCVAGLLDYEERNLFEISVIATDAGGLSSAAVVRVQLIDVNDNDPAFYPKIYETTVSEDAPVGTHVITVKATDPDQNSAIAYEIAEGNGNDHFSLGQNGQISIRRSLSPTSGRKWNLKVKATDSGGRSSLASVVVNVAGPKYPGPIFEEGHYNFRIEEDASISTVLGSVSASPPGGGTVRYSISSGDPHSYFQIDAISGTIRTANTLDHEKDSSLLLNIQVTSDEPRAFSHAQVEITILDVNDNSPQFDVTDTEVGIGVAESTEVGTTIYSVRATDKDSGAFGRVTYSLLEGAEEYFGLNSQSGDIRLLKSLDYESVKRYRLVIGASDGGLPPRLAPNLKLLMEVQDVNDNGPEFDRETYEITVSESIPLNSHILEVRAGDNDSGNNGRISYALSQESDIFGIFSSTGILYLKSPLDRETKENYTLQILATDHGIPARSSAAKVTVSVADENDNDPSFPDSFYSFSIDENNVEGCYVGVVRAVDRDVGDNAELRYFLQPFHTHFQIDPISGTITATATLDREKTSLHELQVVAHDLGLPQRQTEVIVHVVVQDINDCVPHILEPDDDLILVREEQPEGTEVTKILAIDNDSGSNGTLRYALLQTNDGFGSNEFSIDGETGVIQTSSVLSHERRSRYTLVVKVQDLGLPPLETTRELLVEVIELDDSSQLIGSRTKFSFEVSETAPIGHFLGSLRRNDKATGRLSFSLLQGNADGTFELDKRSGRILLLKKLDYEVTSQYMLQVRVNSAQGVHHLSHVTIDVKDENDERPMFPEDPVYFNVSEDARIGTSVWNLTAVDLDQGLNGLVHYSILNQYPTEKFRINILTGMIYLQEGLDFEAERAYAIAVQATDQAMDLTKRLSTTITVQVSIDDVNDNEPYFVSAPKFSILNSENVGTWVHTVIAVDRDSGSNGAVTYELIGGNEGGYFELNPTNGHIVLVKPLPADVVGFNLSVRASDGGMPPRNATQKITLIIDDLRSYPPQFPQRSYMASVMENSEKGTPVIIVSATVRGERRIKNTFLYVLPQGASDGKFAIHPSTGSISVNGNLDRELQNEYNLTVYAHDSQVMSLYDTTHVTIKILDANDNPPLLSCVNLQVPENQELGVIHTFAGVDPDAGRNGEVTFSISHGNPENTFTVDLHSGQLKSRPLDRERKAVYKLLITAQDQGLPVQKTSCNVTITVTDENDNSPVFFENQYSASIPEDAPLGSTVLTTEATDPDVGINAVILYSLSNTSEAHFGIDNKTGAIIVVGHLDRERIGEYSFEVVATDGGLYDSRSSKAHVHVTVTDVNDNRPRFLTQNPMTVQVSPDAKLGTRITQVLAIDSDSGSNSDITYYLERRNSKFRVHPQTGVITVAEGLTSQNGQIIQLNVSAKDQGKSPLTSSALVVLQIGSIPIGNTLRFSEFKYEAMIPENSLAGSNVIQVTALRNDGRRQKMLYTIVGGNEEGGFDVETSTGQIRVQNGTVLDRERYKNFSLIVSAKTDSGGTSPSAYTAVHITLLDENDSSPEFTQNVYTASVWEGNSKGAFAIQVSAKDADEGLNKNLVYYIVDGNEDNAFSIDPPYSGIVKTNIVLDREIQDSYLLTIIATDEGSPQMTGTCLLQINVIDVNDNLPTFPPHSVVSISEDSEIGSLITTVMANDVDTNPDLVYAFTPNGNPGQIFSLGKYDGQIRLLKYLDYEAQKSHQVQIRVSDSVHDALTNLTINVLDGNDNSPRFIQTIYEGVLADNADPGTEILRLTATDLDSPPHNQIKYSLEIPKSQKSRVLGRSLRIDEATGQIYTNDTLFRKQEILFGEVTVVATDLGKLSSKATLWIQIHPSDDDVVKFIAKNHSVDVFRDTLPGTQILKLDVEHGPQMNPGVHFHYSITSGNSDDLFTIDNHTGDLLVARKILQSNWTDSYKLGIGLSCISLIKCNANASVLVNIKQAEDYLTFKQAAYRISVSERKPVGATLFQFQPEFQPKSISYFITSGLDGGNGRAFDLNSKTGTLKLKSYLDFEAEIECKLVIRAQTHTTWTLLTLVVEIEDANDHSPTFPLSNYLEFVAENEPVGTPVFTAQAVDLDAGQFGNLSYSILESSVKDKFLIDSFTGVVRTATVFNYETFNRFHFTLRAMDAGGLSSRVKVLVEVESRDEFPPKFTQKTYRFGIPSNARAGYIVGTVRATDEDDGIDGLIQYQIIEQNGHFRINRTTGTVTLKKFLRSDLNTSLSISASSGQIGSKTQTALAEITVGPPSAHLGSAHASEGVADWVIGLLAGALVILLLASTIFLFLHLRQKKRERDPSNGKPDVSYNNSNFDTLEYAQSTMLAGASGRPSSLYSPQYSDLADIGLHRARHIVGNPSSELSNKSHNSASSGRGSAEEGEEGVDEEIRMINEGRLREQKLRESIGMLGQGGDESEIKNTQEYLARLGIRPSDEYDGCNPTTHAHDGIPLDISTLIYSQIPENEDLDNERKAAAQASINSLSSIIHNDGELGGSYSWDYLQHWGPQYQPLAHVFSEIARLNEDVASARSEGHYSGIHSVRSGPAQASSSNNSISGRSVESDHSSRVTSSSKSKSNQSRRLRAQPQPTPSVNSNLVRGPLPAVPILPRSPLTTDPCFASPLSPSFSPELSFCSSPVGMPEHVVGIRTMQHAAAAYSAADPTEMKV